MEFPSGGCKGSANRKGFTQSDDEGLKKRGGKGSVTFLGKIMARDAQITCIFGTENKLLKIWMLFITDEVDCIPFYKKAKTALIKKYGKPIDDLENYRWPYKKGDGHTEQAVRVNKAHFHTDWKDDDDDSRMSIHVMKSLAVVITYESKAWGKESDRRQSEEAKDL